MCVLHVLIRSRRSCLYMYAYPGVVLSSNLTCEEAELTSDEYLKILWTAAAELPGMSLNSTDKLATHNCTECAC